MIEIDTVAEERDAAVRELERARADLVSAQVSVLDLRAMVARAFDLIETMRRPTPPVPPDAVAVIDRLRADLDAAVRERDAAVHDLDAAVHDLDALREQVAIAGAERATAIYGLTVRDACRRRHPIGAADAQALEYALTLTERERDAAVHDLDALRDDINEIADTLGVGRDAVHIQREIRRLVEECEALR